MTGNNAAGLGAHSLGGHQEFLLFQGHDLSSYQTGHAGPAGEGVGQDNSAQAALQHHHEEHDDHQIGDTADDFQDTHHDVIQLSAEITGDTAVDNAQKTVNERHRCGNRQGDPGAVPDADKNIAAQNVSAENMHISGTGVYGKWRLMDKGYILLADGEGGKNRNKNCAQNQEHQDRQTYDSYLTATYTAHGVLPEADGRADNRFHVFGVFPDGFKLGSVNVAVCAINCGKIFHSRLERSLLFNTEKSH